MEKEDNKHSTATRKNSPPIKVYCLPQEAEAIKAQAKAVGLPVAAYLRRVGLGMEIKSVLDYARVDDMARINADLGRLGGLLKLWLTDEARLQAHPPEQIREVLVKIERNQEHLRALMRAVVSR